MVVLVLARIPYAAEKSDWILMDDSQGVSLYLKWVKIDFQNHRHESGVRLSHCLAFSSGGSQQLKSSHLISS